MPNVTQSASEVMTNNTTTSLHGTTAADRSANRQQAEAPNATHGETTGIERVQDSPPTVGEFNLSRELLNIHSNYGLLFSSFLFFRKTTHCCRTRRLSVRPSVHLSSVEIFIFAVI